MNINAESNKQFLKDMGQRIKLQVEETLNNSERRRANGKVEAWKPLTGEYIPIMRGDEVQKYIPLPAYGEVKLICHDGKIKYIETTTKEKVE